MPLTSEKNKPLLGPANALDYGAGQLTQQLADETAEERRRKQMLGQVRALAPQTTSLLPGLGMGGGRGIR
jgi:hypothetical protein